MISKVMQVFYGEDCLPYKDSDRTIHFPIVGTAISGSSNVNEIRFYVNRIGGATNTTWVAISKLPNGKTSTEILSTVVEDTELGEYYIVFNLTAYYTQFKGDLYISLQGFQNGVSFSLVNGVYELSGTPTVQATGSIKIPINYAPVVHNYQLPVDQLTQILALFSSYNQITNSIVVLINTSVDVSGYEEGQLFFVKSDGGFYRLTSGSLVLEAKIKSNVVVANTKYQLNDYDVITEDENGNVVISSASGKKVIYSGSEIANKGYTDTNFASNIGVNGYTSATELFIQFDLYSKDDDEISSTIYSIPLATTTNAGLLEPSDKSKLNNTPAHTIASLGSKIDKTSIVDNLTTPDATKVLSAWQGRTLENKKVDKTTTIMGIDLANDITRSEVITAIGEATQSLSGVMSATDKSRLDALHALLNEGSANDVVDSINEILAIFNNYPEGVDIVTALAGKVDKIDGMGLSHNDYSDTEKGKVTTAYNHSLASGNQHATKFSELNDKPTTLSGYGITDTYTKSYIDSLKDMNGWESELITETPLTNGQSVTLVTLQSFDVIKLFARNTSTNEIDTDSFETSLGLVSGYEYRLFDNADIKFVIGSPNCTFTTTSGYELSIIGQKYTDLVASDVAYGESDVQTELERLEEDKADKDGDYPLMSVGEANVSNLSNSAKQLLSTLYVNDKVPYSLRTSGGSADIGDRLYDKIVGGTLVWNQQSNKDNYEATKTTNGITFINNGDGTITANGTTTGDGAYYYMYRLSPQPINLKVNHKYLIKGCPTGGGSTTYRLLMQDTTLAQLRDETGDGSIFTASYTDYAFFIRIYAGTTVTNLTFAPQIYDLTQMFGSTIADYLAGLSNNGGVNWFNNYFKKDIYAYDARSLQSVQVSSHKMIGFNAYNNATGKAQLLGGNQYQIIGTYSSILYSTGETLTPDVNGKFTPTKDGELTVVGGNATDICVHLVWSGSRDGEFEPYEENEYTLDSTKVLRGIPKLDVNNKLYYDGDEYLSEGKVIRKYGTRAYQSGDESEPTFRTDMTNTVYPLETPTEETATPFTNPQVVNDFGTEEYVDAGTRDFTMPVGHDTNYLQNLRDKLQRLPDAPTTDGVYVVNYADSVCTYMALSTWLTENNYKANVIPDAPTTDGDYTLKVSIVDGVATYSWETI